MHVFLLMTWCLSSHPSYIRSFGTRVHVCCVRSFVHSFVAVCVQMSEYCQRPGHVECVLLLLTTVLLLLSCSRVSLFLFYFNFCFFFFFTCAT